MPGTPPITPNFSIPRLALADDPLFPAQWTAAADVIDSAVRTAVDAVETAQHATWERLFHQVYRSSGTLAGATLYYWSLTTANHLVNGAGGGGPLIMRLDPARYTIGGRVPKCKVRVNHRTNAATMPPFTWTVGLYPLTSISAAAAVTLGTLVSGTTVAFAASPAVNSRLIGISSEFNMPAAGHYVFGALTGAGASGVYGISGEVDLLLRYG